MRRLWVLLACGLAILLGPVHFCAAGIRAPGKYCGTPVFDRWDGCILYSGVYVMYVSEKTKDGLRPHVGKAVRIDAKEVYQPVNPGDGRIGDFDYIGLAPEGRTGVRLDRIRLTSSVKVREDGKPVAGIIIANTAEEPVKLFSGELALTLLAKRNADGRPLSVSDGPSLALITRQSFEIGADRPRWEGKGVRQGRPYAWTIGEENALPHDFTLKPKERKQIDITLDLPDGEYAFLCGYGGGVHESKCLTGNLSAFDVKDGKALVVTAERK